MAMPKALIAVLVAGLNIGAATAAPISCNLQSEQDSYAAYLERQRGKLSIREKAWLRASNHATFGERQMFLAGLAKPRVKMAVKAFHYQIKMDNAEKSGDKSTACRALQQYKKAMNEVVHLRQKQLKSLPNTLLGD